MGKSSKAPSAPDPQKTAAAQTATNVATAVANATLGNVNQVTPDGKLTYTQGKSQFISDPNGQSYYYQSGGDQQYHLVDGDTAPHGHTIMKGYLVPSYTATTSLSPSQQYIKDQGDAAQGNLAATANERSAFLKDYLSKSIDKSKLPKAGDPRLLATPEYRGLLGTADLQKNLASAGAVQNGYDSGGNIASTFGNAGAVQQGIGDAGAITNSFNGGGPIASSAANAGTIANGYNAGGPITTSIAGAGNIATGFDAGGKVQGSIADAGNISRTFGDAGGVTRSYGTDFSQDRQKVEDALMTRLNPQLQQDRSALEQRLANQGLQPGSEAYNRAVDEANRSASDARIGVLLAGGQEQSRLAGLAQQQAAFQNSAQQQAYEQAAGRGQFANSAQQQEFSQNAARQQAANAAVAQQYQQNQGRAAFQNAAQQQLYGQNQTNAVFQNAAQAQANQQNQAAAAFQNSAQSQRYGQNLSDAQLQNAAQQQQYAQNQGQAAFANDAQQQLFGQQAARQQAANAAQQQANQQNMQAAAFGNQAQQQRFGQNVSEMQTENAARQQTFDNANAARQYGNTLQDQRGQYQLQQYNAANAARAAALNEQFALRNQPLNEVTSLLSGAQVDNPNFVSTNMPQIQPVDYAGLVQQNYANQVAAYNAQQQAQQGLFGGLLDIGAAAAGNKALFSDKRLKKNIKQIGKLKDGQRLYSYQYKGTDQPQVGLLAQEVEKRNPSAVGEVNGWKTVNYNKALGGLLSMGAS